MDDGQKTPRGHPDFNSYVKYMERTNGRTEKLIRCGLGNLIGSSRYQSKTICENKNFSYEAHLCPNIVQAQRAPNAQATLQIADRQYEEFLSPAALTLKPLRRPSIVLDHLPNNISSDCAHI
jgi:hypothetical protein